MTRKEYSDELLNAYLDDELASDERKHLIEDLRDDMDLRQRVCQLEQIRNMVRIAYHDISHEPSDPVKIRSHLKGMAAVAATLFVLIGSIIGWFANQQIHPQQGLLQLADINLNQPSANYNKTWQILMHVTSDDPYRVETLLDETEALLNQYEKLHKQVAVQILANGKGLNLLRSDKSPYGQRIAELNKRFNNITFVACATAMKRLQTEQGINVQLLPDTKVVPSALHEVLEKQKQGWTYIKI